MDDYREPNILYLIFGILLIIFGLFLIGGTFLPGYWDSGAMPWPVSI